MKHSVANPLRGRLVVAVALGAVVATGITLLFRGPLGLVIGVILTLVLGAVKAPRAGALAGACTAALVGFAVAVAARSDFTSPLILVLVPVALMYAVPGALLGFIGGWIIKRQRAGNWLLW
jgi:hypothetical protein